VRPRSGGAGSLVERTFDVRQGKSLQMPRRLGQGLPYDSSCL